MNPCLPQWIKVFAGATLCQTRTRVHLNRLLHVSSFHGFVLANATFCLVWRQVDVVSIIWKFMRCSTRQMPERSRKPQLDSDLSQVLLLPDTEVQRPKLLVQLLNMSLNPNEAL